MASLRVSLRVSFSALQSYSGVGVLDQDGKIVAVVKMTDVKASPVPRCFVDLFPAGPGPAVAVAHLLLAVCFVRWCVGPVAVISSTRMRQGSLQLVLTLVFSFVQRVDGGIAPRLPMNLHDYCVNQEKKRFMMCVSCLFFSCSGFCFAALLLFSIRHPAVRGVIAC